VSSARVRISLRDLSKTFTQDPREVPAVCGVSFDVSDQEFVAIVGPSGCGKSTILNMIGALVSPSSG
jgi:ABC-type sugar transport system ATPase subunit